MDQLKRILGLVWIVIAIASIIILVTGAFQNIDVNGKSDIQKPLPWVIIISIFTPIAIGMVIFGWYAWKGEYDGEIKT
jgi:fatty acid desaturase